jgi:PhzF family phenazine biosynthesis protein
MPTDEPQHPASSPDRIVVDFAFVDVFATQPLTGNALTVVPDADGLDVATMKAISREFNQSETTFLVAPTARADRRLRSFTAAGHEVGGAGHNALGAWLWLADAGRVDAGRFLQQIGKDVLPVEVRIEAGSIEVAMRQSPPSFGRAVDDRALLAAALGIDTADVVTDRPAQVVSTGAAHLLVPVTNRSVLDSLTVDTGRLAAVLRSVGGEGCYVYTLDRTPPATADTGDAPAAFARFFNPTIGIVEDPATGTAAGPLATALVRHGDVAGDQPVVIEQGNAMGRPSRLRIDVHGDTVLITGSGRVVGSGQLVL